jgi:hypothetical protein
MLVVVVTGSMIMLSVQLNISLEKAMELHRLLPCRESNQPTTSCEVNLLGASLRLAV